ncbi:hypothetical protein [Formosa haliotis]|nr:hypothetical protein [Formosa haliotis]
MKPTSNQYARVGQIRKPSYFKAFNLNGMINRIDSSSKIIPELKTK